jgi:non-heme chloroperoxidase
MQTHNVTGGAGLRLHVREWGIDAAPSILFVHGWSQNHLCWRNQYESPLAQEFQLIALDLRGHCMSDAPTGTEHYTEPQLKK